MGTRENATFSLQTPFQSVEDELCSNREYKKEIQRKEIEENIQHPRNFGPVAPGIPIQTWRDQEEDEREDQQQFRVTSLAYCPNRVESEKLRMEENKWISI